MVGVSYRVMSPERIQSAAVADHFHGALSAQDAGGWRAHVTIQNKVTSSPGRDLLNDLQPQFIPRRKDSAD